MLLNMETTIALKLFWYLTKYDVIPYYMKNLPKEPTILFKEWFDNAKADKNIPEPTAMNLATATKEGKPSNRMVLLKDCNKDGFVFYTNLGSRKSKELEENPFAALCFYWQPLGKQVRVEGKIEQVSDAEADTYFASRNFKSRVGAWASKQSQTMENEAELLKRIATQSLKSVGGDLARPPFWSGFRVIPDAMEFWILGKNRIHKRTRYEKDSYGWNKSILYP